MTAPGFDPTLPMRESAEYLGFRGADPTKSLRRLVEKGEITRTAIPSPQGGAMAWGVKLSELNRYRDSLMSPSSRKHVRTRVSA